MKAFSINSAYYRDRAVKTRDCRMWEEHVLHLMAASGPQQAIKDIKSAYNPEEHAFSIRLCHVYPKDFFFNAKGRISSRTFDLSNTEKLLIDLLFDEKHQRTGISPIETLATNDCNLVRLYSYKMPGDDYAIKITISLVKKPTA